MAGNGGMGGGNADGVNGGHPQGTEYTLQGKLSIENLAIYRSERLKTLLAFTNMTLKLTRESYRGDAISTNRMAST